MCKTSLSVWFVCRLCRGSFGQVDAFIEHKKQKHFTQFQNTTSIVFEEVDPGEQRPVIARAENEFVDENNEPSIKIEVSDEDPMDSFNSDIIDEPNVDLYEFKSELITVECEINADDENNFADSMKQPEQNPYVLLKRLTSTEIQRACVPKHPSRLSKFKEKNVVTNPVPPNLSTDVDSNIGDHNKTENQPTTSVKHDTKFECKLCSKQLESESQLKIHVGICAQDHEDRHRFCFMCNRKFSYTKILKRHRLRFHGTEEEKSSLYRFQCHVCPKQCREAAHLRSHFERRHIKEKKVTKQQVKAPTADSKLLKCAHPNCGKEFGRKSTLTRHQTTHLDVRPFSCPNPGCNKTYTQRIHLTNHFRIHTGERPYKCIVENCDKAFRRSYTRLMHLRTVHHLSESNE